MVGVLEFLQGDGVELAALFDVFSFEVGADPFAGVRGIGGEEVDWLE